MKILPVLLKDGYKVGHVFQYPPDTTRVYSNLTPRSTRIEGIDEAFTTTSYATEPLDGVVRFAISMGDLR